MRTAVVAWLLVAGSGCLPTEDPPAPRWHYLHAAIVQPNCATSGCHSALTAIAGVNLADAEGAYVVLTGHLCGQPPHPQDAPRNYVTPGSAEYSELVYQLRGADSTGRSYRNVMPRDTRLPETEIALIESWIDAGAACD